MDFVISLLKTCAMRLYHIGIGTLVKRFFFITALIVVCGFLALYVGNVFWYFTALAFPVFLSCLLGIEFDGPIFRKLHVKHHEGHPADYHPLIH